MNDEAWKNASIDELRILYADRLSDLEYEYGLRCAYESALQTARLNNSYSLDAFAPVSEEDWRRLNDLVQREFGHGIDRYVAALMVDAWDNCARTIEGMVIESIAASDASK